jgi:hypothetical protein
MQSTADFHHHVTDTRLPEAAGGVDDATALDAAVDVREAHAAAREAPMRGFWRPREGPAARRLGRHAALDLRPGEGQAAPRLAPPIARRQGEGGGLGHPLLMGPARRGLAQQEARERGMAQEHVRDGMGRVLAAITPPLLRRSLGAREASCGALVAHRGEAGAGAGAAAGSAVVRGAPAVGATMAAASASPRRVAHAVKKRLGASPSPRRVARRTPKRACSHGWAGLWPIPNRRPCTTGRGEVFRSTRIHSRRSSGVGSGQLVEVV